MKWHGIIGFIDTVETEEGIYEEQKIERLYYGDIIRLSRRYDNGNTAIDNLSISNQFSIISDPYATLNFVKMKYIEWMGNKWEISDIEVQYPRLILTVGGLYNEDEEEVTPEPPDDSEEEDDGD